MRYIEAVCKECKNEFKITFKNDIPPFDIVCPLCGNNVKYIKINSQ
jgi:hypothetical protein